MATDIKLIPPARRCLEMLADAGHEAFVVGGYVRDSLLDRAAYDVDVTTAALPDEIAGCFRDYTTKQINKRHGTVTVIFDEPDGRYPIEITTYRIDGSYSDNRHPDAVEFTRKLSEDLSRRDFTINAMAYNEHTGLVDLFGGRDDLERHTIAVIGNGVDRFTDDALRIVRAFRFSAQLDFAIDEQTLQAAVETAPLLKNISRERKWDELCRMLRCRYPWHTLTVMEQTGILPYIWPLSLPQQFTDCIDCTVRLANLIGDNNLACLDSLPISRHQRVEVEQLVRNRHCRLESDIDIKHAVGKLGLEAVRRLHWLRGKSDDRLNAVMAKKPCCTCAQLAVSGRDVVAAGFAGSAIGDTMDILLAIVQENDSLNDRVLLLTFLKEIQLRSNLKGEADENAYH